MDIGSIQALVNLDHVWTPSAIDIQSTYVPMTLTFEDGVKNEVATDTPKHDLLNKARSSILVNSHPLLNNLFLDQGTSKPVSETSKTETSKTETERTETSETESETLSSKKSTKNSFPEQVTESDREEKKGKKKEKLQSNNTLKNKKNTDIVGKIPSIEAEDGNLVNCMLCQASFADTVSLKAHVSSNHKVYYYYCSQCRCTFQDVKSLLDHSPSHVLEQILRFIKSHRIGCCICWQGFSDFRTLTDHVNNEHNLNISTCLSCQFLCLDPKDLAKHEQIHVSGSPKGTSKFGSLATVCNCKVCGLELETREDVTQHMKMHKSGSMYVCEFCGECFCTRQKVIQHRRVHTGDKPFRCKLCHFSCNRKDNLKGHLRRIHSQAERPLSKKTRKDIDFNSIFKKDAKPEEIANVQLEPKVLMEIQSDKLSSNICTDKKEDNIKSKNQSYICGDDKSMNIAESTLKTTDEKSVIDTPIKTSMNGSECSLLTATDLDKAAIDLGKLPSSILLPGSDYDSLVTCSVPPTSDLDEPSKKRQRLSSKIQNEISPAFFLRGPPEKLLNGNNVSYHSGSPSQTCSDVTRRDGSMLMISPDKIFQSSPSHQTCSNNLISFSDPCSSPPTRNPFLSEGISSVLDEDAGEYSEYFAEFSNQGDFLQSLGLVKEGAIPELPDPKLSPPRERNIYLEFVQSLEAEGKKEFKKPIKLKGFSHYESTCYKCKEEFDSKQALKEHLHGYKENGRFPCDICNYPLKELRKLMEHRRSHTGEKPYKCNQCEFKCSRRDNLAVHMKKHSK